MRILIAEDDPTSRAMLATVLDKAGYEVVEAPHGTEAWRQLQQPDGPRLAILDWGMPGMDGLELIRQVRSLPAEQRTYLIMLTIRDDKTDVTAALEAGADDYVAKPFDPGELLARIQVGCRLLNMQDMLAAKVQELSRALEQIRTLRGIVPICANCKKIRDDEGFWQQVEVYVRDHTEAEFSHGICPECMENLYPGAYQDWVCRHSTSPET